MKPSIKFILGFFTFFPIIVLFIFIFYFIYFLSINPDFDFNHKFFPFHSIFSIFWLLILIIITAAIRLGITIYYIIHVNNLVNNDTNKKIIWTIILILGGNISSVIYYLIEIIPSEKDKIIDL